MESHRKPRALGLPVQESFDIDFIVGAIPNNPPGIVSFDIDGDYEDRQGRPIPVSLDIECGFILLHDVVSSLFDVRGIIITEVSKATYLGTRLHSKISAFKLKTLSVVSSDPYFSDSSHWRAVFSVYWKSGSEYVISIRHYNMGGGDLVGRELVTSDVTLGTYNKTILILGLNGSYLVVPSTDIDETITVVA